VLGILDHNVIFNSIIICTRTLIADVVTNTKVFWYAKIYILAAFHNWEIFVSPRY